MGDRHETVNRHSGIIRCACFLSFDLPGTPCLSRWERWPGAVRTERSNAERSPKRLHAPLGHLR